MWENECRKRNIVYRPSVGLTKVAKFAEQVWSKLGELAAKVGNQVLGNLDELSQTAVALAKPIVDTATSPIYFYWSYIRTVSQYRYPILATIGTVAVGLMAAVAAENRRAIFCFVTRRRM